MRIARRIDELPACWALFEAGRLTEDAMVCIARRVPAGRDAEVAAWAPGMLVSQLRRALAILPASCPTRRPTRARPSHLAERFVRSRTTADGWLKGEFCLPPSEAPIVAGRAPAARDAEFRDRQGLEADAEPRGRPRPPRRVTWADAFVRMASEAADALDPTLARTGYRGRAEQGRAPPRRRPRRLAGAGPAAPRRRRARPGRPVPRRATPRWWSPPTGRASSSGSRPPPAPSPGTSAA